MWPPDSEDTNEENGGENVSPKNNLDTRQPAGDPPAADMSAISRGELEESEKAVEKLRDLLSLAKKDQENAMPKIRKILSEHPDLAQRFMHLGRMGEDWNRKASSTFSAGETGAGYRCGGRGSSWWHLRLDHGPPTICSYDSPCHSIVFSSQPVCGLSFVGPH